MNATSGYACLNASATKASGSASARAVLGALTTFVLPRGSSNLWFSGKLELAAGFAHAALSRSHGLQARAFVTVFYSFHLKDLNGSGGAAHGWGLIWWGGPLSCPSTGGYVNVSSPVLNSTFNSTSYFTSYGFHSAGTYAYSVSVGCEAQVTIFNASAPVTAGAGCNDAANPSHNTISILTMALA